MSENSRTHSLVIAALALAGLLGWHSASATVVHQVLVEFDDDFDAFNGTDRDGARLSEPRPDDITTAITAAVAGSGYRASATLGQFGALGVQAAQVRTGEMMSQVYVADDDIVNPLGVARRAVANFIIDGGRFNLTAAADATGLPSFIEWQLDVTSSIDGVGAGFFQTYGRMESTDFTNVALTTGGQDIGAAFVGTSGNEVEIPLGFYSFEIGVLPPSGVLEIEYLLTIESEGRSVEGIFWQFSDPLDVAGAGFVSIDYLPIDPPVAVPAPTPAALLLAGLPVLAGLRRRVRAKR